MKYIPKYSWSVRKQTRNVLKLLQYTANPKFKLSHYEGIMEISYPLQVMRMLSSKPKDPISNSHSKNKLNLFLGSPEFNSFSMLTL